MSMKTSHYLEVHKVKYIPLVVLFFMLASCVVKEKPPDSTSHKYEGDKEPDVIIELDEPKSPIDKTSEPDEWKLVWRDEFHSNDSLLNWNLQDWASDKNGEWQYYSPHNISVQEDLLIIESRREQFKGRQYTSGALTTEGKFEFKYGKVEIKAKIPKGQGVFPAFWLVNSDHDNWLPEIDIMENLGQFPHQLHYVVHWVNDSQEKMRDYYQYEREDIDFSEDFHIYGLLWTEDKIVWMLDGISVFETQKYSPDVPLFLYLNTAIGGYWPGKPDPFDEYPKQMQVDYVKVFQQENRR